MLFLPALSAALVRSALILGNTQLLSRAVHPIHLSWTSINLSIA